MAKTTTDHHQHNRFGRKHQPIRRHQHQYNKLFETNHTIKNTEVRTQIKPGCFPIQQNARPIQYHIQQDVKNELDRLIMSGHLKRLKTTEEDCFVSPAVITVKKDKTVKIALNARKLNECCV